jgi:methylenetetrahydrofolate dehydrogenase (NADP+)/methenyltetrahydrofolate cyclohydrolase
MTGAIIDGRAVAAALRADIGSQVKTLATPPGLAVIMVGDHSASQVYVAGKIKACAEIGISSHVYRLGNQATEAEVFAVIDALNDNDRVHGVLLQLPLPAHLDALRFLERIDPRKDVDGLHPTNLGLLFAGRPRFVPCTPQGAMRLLHTVLPNMRGANAVVIGRSILVGKPMAALLTAAHATVTLAHSATRDLPDVTRSADILVVAAGSPHMIGRDHVKEGTVVIDVGITRTGERLVGDVDFEAVRPICRAITPVPGGVGPMTIACLLHNTLEATPA